MSQTKNIKIAITRPQQSAEMLAKKIAALKIIPVIFPCMAITEASQEEKIQAEKYLQNLYLYDFILFISPIAAEKAKPYLKNMKHIKNKLLGAVGNSTARRIRELGLGEAYFPEGQEANSQALLAWPRLQKNLAHQKILLCKGEGGNPVLADTLRARGAEVHEAILYARALPPPPTAWQWTELLAADLIICTSSTGLEYLVRLADTAGLSAKLREKKLLLSSATLAETAKTLGWTAKPVLANNATDEEITRVLGSIY